MLHGHVLQSVCATALYIIQLSQQWPPVKAQGEAKVLEGVSQVKQMAIIVCCAWTLL